MNFKHLIYFSFTGLLFTAACNTSKPTSHNYLMHTATATEIAAMDNKMERVYHLLMGHFSNKRQAQDSAHNPLYQEQEIIAVPMWRKRTGEYWIYMGWFRDDAPDKALAQGIFQLSRKDRDTFVLKSFIPPDEVGNNFYANEWRKEKPFDKLSPRDLIHDPGCVNYIVPREDGSFVVIPDENGPCKRFISDQIRYYELDMTLSPEAHTYYTQYFDQNQKFIFGYAKPDGQRYERLPKDTPKYMSLE